MKALLPLSCFLKLCQSVRYKRVKRKDLKKTPLKQSVSFACLLLGPNEK